MKPFDAITLFRERTPISAELLGQLPNLKLISQRSVYPHVDVDACTLNGVLLCSNMHVGTPSFAAAEHTWALILAAMRSIPQQMASVHKGQWQFGVGKTLSALNNNELWQTALDVFDEEPIGWTNDPLATHPKVIATPHIGFVTEDELDLQFSDIFDQVVAFHHDEPIHMINPEVGANESSILVV